MEGLYYPYSENKGADQLRGYRDADLRLCFAYAKSQFSHDAAHLLSYPVCMKSLWLFIESSQQNQLITKEPWRIKGEDIPKLFNRAAESIHSAETKAPPLN